MLKAGIDTGGTFTDCIVLNQDYVFIYKTLSSPHDPACAVRQGLDGLGRQVGQVPNELVHGTTVATNALLEHKLAPVCLMITAGFKDLVQIGRQQRQNLYGFYQAPEHVLYQHVIELPERISANGEILKELSASEIQILIQQIPAEIEAIAICCLFGYAWPQHEQKLARALRELGYLVSASHEVLPVYREFERFSTTLANSALQPVMQNYMAQLQHYLNHLPCRLMQSNGGSLQADTVARLPVRCVLSGPAGGVLGAQMIAAKSSIQKLLTFDMGGTSTDVSLIDQSLLLRSDMILNQIPIAVPMLDIHTVGAGGGSLVNLDAGGALRVGPESAGAVPGPVCYGQGQQLTVTDANLFLGRLPYPARLSGELELQLEPVKAAFARLSQTLQLEPETIAQGIIDIANASMERALRKVSVERGYDPQEYTLFCFGGAGGLHVCDLARALGISNIMVPMYAGVFSALGMLFAPDIEDISQTVLGRYDLSQMEQIQAEFEALQNRLIFDPQADYEYEVDLRYQGQSFEITVACDPANIPQSVIDFHRAHQRLRAYHRPEAVVELVNLRVRKIIPATDLDLPLIASSQPRPISAQQAVFLGHWQEIPIWQRQDLVCDQQIIGPALICEETSTLLLTADFDAKVDPYGHLILRLKLGVTA